MNIEAIIRTLSLLGSSTPAFKALWEQVKSAFGEDDQAELQRSYEQAMAGSDAAHRDAQSL